jgi:DNA-binding LytR/AlgR family response regulator
LIKCIVIDDEPIARAGLKKYIGQIDFLQLAGEFKNPVDAVKALDNDDIDLVFLDIQMPGLSGIDFLKSVRIKPQVIIISGNPNHALEGYELNIVDYLLKPASFTRFFKACTKAREILNHQLAPVVATAEGNEFFYIKSSHRYIKIFVHEIVYIESMVNYVSIFTHEAKHIAYLTLKVVENKLPAGLFIKIHKSFLVAANAIRFLDAEQVVLTSNQVLPIGKTYKTEIVKMIEQHLYKR